MGLVNLSINHNNFFKNKHFKIIYYHIYSLLEFALVMVLFFIIIYSFNL